VSDFDSFKINKFRI